jgi:AraC family transcriptional regulator
MAKHATQASYQARLDRVVDHLYAHLDEDMRPEALAEIACLSPYHWHRIYVAMRGETIGATIRRLRLLRAADRLANSQMPMTTIAERAGYSGADSFAHAFREAYDKTPRDYRATGSHAAFKAATESEDHQGFPIAIETLPATRCASIAHSGAYLQIDRAMDRLFTALAAQNKLAPDQAMCALFFDDPDLVPVEALRSRACSPIADDLPLVAPLEEIVLRGGRYARLRYRGPYTDMREAYRWLLGVWLPQSGYEPDDDPIFETYLNNPQHVAPADLLTDIHLPLGMP